MDIAIFLSFYPVLGGYHHTAQAAPDKSAEGLRVIRGIFGRLASLFQGGLNLVKKLLGNNRLVFAFVKFPGVTKQPDIEGIGQHIGNLVAFYGLAALGRDTFAGKEVGGIFQPPVALGVEFKRAPHNL
ncbi:MAG: hypothetical protein A2782_03195 [Candidatus Blackburnbacteria bacterium RIFCSPHIGHO2_01_FULL_43_15b]|uniref:Uncharacterized protein n=1 Tax=Candidatus Blackburnbacteria bacterium RIFCSPHIGHO2_01_FULL_43_15b TaxID=1797513 RepID=A0A1G1V172_9BACT|nr:MAG: hypothetical protein A2782_03195 [Candidatus Blackburnbacteria bacterium RIFCSPHIGHO2_01_FULL_43_15b]